MAACVILRCVGSRPGTRRHGSPRIAGGLDGLTESRWRFQGTFPGKSPTTRLFRTLVPYLCCPILLPSALPNPQPWH
jgi:hypothetical protein